MKVGISSCLMGEKVRFDGGHKNFKFATEELLEHIDFVPFCPEMAAGMGVPRATIRLVEQNNQINLLQPKTGDDFTQTISDMPIERETSINQLSGYIVCKGSPSCGMSRIPVYNEAGHSIHKKGIGLYTQSLIKQYPWLPVEEDGRLNDIHLRENFITRVYSLSRFQNDVMSTPSLQAIQAFHRKHKFLLLAHNPEKYYRLGRHVAQINKTYLQRELELYRNEFMAALAKPASKKNHTNTLTHIQGFLKKHITSIQKKELCEVIDQYRSGIAPLFAPITLLNHYINDYQIGYLQEQYYFSPYPQDLRLRYSI